MDRLGNEASFLDRAVRMVVLETAEKLHLLGHSLNKTQTQLKTISHDSHALPWTVTKFSSGHGRPEE